MLLQVLSDFQKTRYLRKLYKEGLLEILRPWLSYNSNPEEAALTAAVLTFLNKAWITKNLISNYSFDIGKAIVKVKKHSTPSNKQLAESVQKYWTEILTTEEKPEPVPEIAVYPSSYSPEQLISSDSVALRTRSRVQIAPSDMIYPKRVHVLF